MKRWKAHVRYRIVCSLHGQNEMHRYHEHEKPTREKAEKSVQVNNGDPVFTDDPVPVHRGCLPWKIEAQVVSDWGDQDAIERLVAAMNGKR